MDLTSFKFASKVIHSLVMNCVIRSPKGREIMQLAFTYLCATVLVHDTIGLSLDFILKVFISSSSNAK